MNVEIPTKDYLVIYDDDFRCTYRCISCIKELISLVAEDTAVGLPSFLKAIRGFDDNDPDLIEFYNNMSPATKIIKVYIIEECIYDKLAD